jgi:DNA-directed RNA polymerase specialized sigma24 family protein
MNATSLLQENAFDSLLTDLSHKLRPLAWRYSQAFTDLDSDDFLAIGLEGAAHVSRKTGNTDLPYLYGVARNYMTWTFAQRRLHDIPSCSLDHYLYNKESDRERFIAEDITTNAPEASTAMKARVARLLATLPEKHQRLLQARYHIEDADGAIPTVDQVRKQYHLTSSNFNNMCNSALIMCLRNSERQGVC